MKLSSNDRETLATVKRLLSDEESSFVVFQHGRKVAALEGGEVSLHDQGALGTVVWLHDVPFDFLSGLLR